MRFIALLISALLAGIYTETLIAANSDAQSTSGAGHGQMLRRTIVHDGVERAYLVHVPPSASQADAKLPVVIGLHGYGSTASGFQAKNGLNRHSDSHGYIAVFVQGSHFVSESPGREPDWVSSWNELAANQGPTAAGPHCTDDRAQYPCPPECGSCKFCDWTTCHDDLGFFEKMLDAVAAEFPTDTDRYYLLGVSTGGMMTLRLGCAIPGRFAAIASIIGQLAIGYACGPAIDSPLLHLYGLKDNTVRSDGKPSGDGFIYSTAAETAGVWATALACSAGPQEWQNETSRQMGLECTAYSRCADETHEVVSCADPDGGHEWPSNFVEGVPATCVTPEQYDYIPIQPHCPSPGDEYVSLGMDLVWTFFSRYRRSE